MQPSASSADSIKHPPTTHHAEAPTSETFSNREAKPRFMCTQSCCVAGVPPPRGQRGSVAGRRSGAHGQSPQLVDLDRAGVVAEEGAVEGGARGREVISGAEGEQQRHEVVGSGVCKRG